MGAEKNPVRTVPWATPLLQEVVRLWIPIIGMGGALMFQMLSMERELRNRIDRLDARVDVMNERLIRVETLLEAHLEDHRRNEAAASTQPALDD